MTLKAARDSSSSSDTPKTMPDFLGSRQWIRSFTAKSRRRRLGLQGGGRRENDATRWTWSCEFLQRRDLHTSTALARSSHLLRRSPGWVELCDALRSAAITRLTH